MGSPSDTFISYRRSNGLAFAGRIYDHLKANGFNPFMDVEGLGVGRFDEQLRDKVLQADNFILILSHGALDRCTSAEDWVRKEIALAIQHNKNIILIFTDGFTFPDSLSSDIESIANYQGIKISQEEFHKRIHLIVNMLLRRVPIDIHRSTKTSIKLKRGSNLSGEYVTYYEDTENGHIVVRRATAHLKQFFNIVRGYTYFGSDQKWLLRGKVIGVNKIAGIYGASSKFDQGVGTFFLEIRSNGSMDGFWSGYDNVSRKLFSGLYIFHPLYKNFTISALKRVDCASVMEIADKQLGVGYVGRQYLLDILAEKGDRQCRVAHDRETGHVIGFCIYSIIDRAMLSEILKGKEVNTLAFHDQVGYLATIAIDDNYQGNGIACKFSELVDKEMRAINVEAIVSTAWKHNGIVNIGGVLERSGYRKKAELVNYWYADSIEKRYQCPKCGNPCNCTCVVYEKTLKKSI